jgi:hypothetical protein
LNLIHLKRKTLWKERRSEMAHVEKLPAPRKHSAAFWIVISIAIFFVLASAGLAGSWFAFWQSPAPGGIIPPAPTPTSTPTETPTPTPTEAPEPTPTPLPKIEVKWERKDPNVKIPPGEEGLYSGTIYNGPIPAVAEPSGPERIKFVKRILPNIQEQNVFLAIARDTNKKSVVFVGVTILDPSEIGEAILRGEDPTGLHMGITKYLFLSVDGEKSWRKVSLSPDNLGGQMSIKEVRVISDKTSIVLFVRPGNSYWRQAILPYKNSLP